MFIFILDFLLALVFSGLTSYAEYRAFELQIEDIEKGKTRTVISTLDHIQYPRYFPLNRNETIRYVDSWMCWENMGRFKKTCPKPERQAGPL